MPDGYPFAAGERVPGWHIPELSHIIWLMSKSVGITRDTSGFAKHLAAVTLENPTKPIEITDVIQ